MSSQTVSRIVIAVDDVRSIARAIDRLRDLEGRIETYTPAAMEKARSTDITRANQLILRVLERDLDL